MDEIRWVLDRNASTLTHLILGASLERPHSWDSAFQSATISKLTRLDLVDTRISQDVLSRVAHAGCLEALTLHGTFEDPVAARVVFQSDHVINGEHTFLPLLTSFRFVLVGHDDELALYQAVVAFLRRRPLLRRLDLGTCPNELVMGLLSELDGLEALRIKIGNLNGKAQVEGLVKCLRKDRMEALHLSTMISLLPMV
jgi:hypothetical protein